MSQPALDKKIEIADAFDRGAFAGIDKVDTDSIAAVVGMKSWAVSRLLKTMGFERVTRYRSVPVRKDRVYEYPARVKLPSLKRIRNEDARTIVEAIGEHRIPRQFTTSLLYSRLGHTLSDYTIGLKGHLPKGLHGSLGRLGFTNHRPTGFKSKNETFPATWRAPLEWPALFAEQRKMRRNGLRVSSVLRATEYAAKLGPLINIALEHLDMESIPYDRRGALRAAIHSIIVDAFDEWLPQQHGQRARMMEKVDWEAIANLSETHLRNFASIAARVDASGANDNPGAYALRWVLENLPGAGMDAALGISANTG